MSESFGECLKRLRMTRSGLRRRRDAGKGCLSQSELAERADLTHGCISRLEGGTRQPDRATVTALAQALNLNDGESSELMHAAGFATESDPDCANLANLLATVDRERGEWIRATVRNLIAMNGGVG